MGSGMVGVPGIVVTGVIVPGLLLPGIVGVVEQKRTPQSVRGSGVVCSHLSAPSISHADASDRTSPPHRQLNKSVAWVKELEQDENVASNLLQLTASVWQACSSYVCVRVTPAGVVIVAVRCGLQVSLQFLISVSKSESKV